MARNPIIRENPPRVPAPTPDETPHACMDGWVYLGFEGKDDDQVVERVPCRRCNPENL
jgi:hypothetical protein